jgi:uncharacterized protein (UPF0248 family)
MEMTKMNTTEQGVDQFVRIMGVSKNEAEDWYKLFQKHRSAHMNLDAIDGEIISRMCNMGINEKEYIDKLKYFSQHLMGHHANRIVLERISQFEGNEDGYEKYLRISMEKQTLNQNNKSYMIVKLKKDVIHGDNETIPKDTLLEVIDNKTCFIITTEKYSGKKLVKEDCDIYYLKDFE